MKKYLIIPLVLAGYLGAVNVAIGDTYQLTRNAAIQGHNRMKLNGSVRICQAMCNKKNWCKSFDYYKNRNRCDLSDKSAHDVGGLKTNYSRNPYDHYQKMVSSKTQNKKETQHTNAPTIERVPKGKICKSEVKATSRSLSKGTAKYFARIAWRAKVSKKYGGTYVFWKDSINQSSSCKRKYKIYRCTVRATPCKTSPSRKKDDPLTQNNSFYVRMIKQNVNQGFIPFMGFWGPVRNAYLTQISVPITNGNSSVSFVRRGSNTKDCSNPSRVVTLRSGEKTSRDQMILLFGESKVSAHSNRIPFVACLVGGSRSTYSFSIKIKYDK